jgi:hypothetical protein
MNHTAPETGVFVALLADENLQVAVDPDGVLVIYPRGDEAVALQIPADLIRQTLEKLIAVVEPRASRPPLSVGEAKAIDRVVPIRPTSDRRHVSRELMQRLQMLGDVLTPESPNGGFDAFIAGVRIDGRDAVGTGPSAVDAIADLWIRLSAADWINVNGAPPVRWSPYRRAWIDA